MIRRILQHLQNIYFDPQIDEFSSASAITAVLPSMIGVALPSNRSGNSMGSPYPQWHRRGSAVVPQWFRRGSTVTPRRKTHVRRVRENYEKLLVVSLRWWWFWLKTVVASRLRRDGVLPHDGRRGSKQHSSLTRKGGFVIRWDYCKENGGLSPRKRLCQRLWRVVRCELGTRW